MDASVVITKVLDILLNPNTDFKGIVYSLSKVDPELLLRLTNTDELKFPELRKYCKAGERINAIKHVRQISGMGLKDSKEFVEDYVSRHAIVSEPR